MCLLLFVFLFSDFLPGFLKLIVSDTNEGSRKLVTEKPEHSVLDLTGRPFVILTPLVLFVIFLGIKWTVFGEQRRKEEEKKRQVISLQNLVWSVNI